MVLPEGIELSTSPLPRECSTTELRQRMHETRLVRGRVRRLALGSMQPDTATTPYPGQAKEAGCLWPNLIRPNTVLRGGFFSIGHWPYFGLSRRR